MRFRGVVQKYKLDLNDIKMLDADADGDGASNRDEFLAGTDPTDPNSRPGVHATIRLKEYDEVKRRSFAKRRGRHCKSSTPARLWES
jgi:hypothetical protein